MGCRYV